MEGMWMEQPACRWQDGLPCGNGEIGALVYGGIKHEIILLNHENLWLPGEKPQLQDVSQQLPFLRECLIKGEYIQAEKQLKQMVEDMTGGRGTRTSYQPAGDLRITMDTREAYTHYRRSLNFADGIAAVQWQESRGAFRRENWVCLWQPMGVTLIKGPEINADIMLTPHFEPAPVELVQACEGKSLPFQHQLKVAKNTIRMDVQYDTGKGYCILLRVGQTGGKLCQEQASLRVCAAKKAWIYWSIADTTGPDTDVLPAWSCTETPEALRRRQKDSFAKAYHRLSLILPGQQTRRSNERLLLDAAGGKMTTALLSKQFQFGRYLLLSSSWGGKLPANLQGIWNGSYSPMWESDFHNDENIHMNYWSAFPAHLPETARAYFDYYDAMVPDFQENARKLYGCRGILAPSCQTTHGRVVAGEGFAAWTAGAGWLAQLYYDAWLFSRDDVFLRERAVPFMRQVALFYEDFLCSLPDGKLHFAPSLSPENVPANHPGTMLCLDATMDVAVAREVLRHLCQAYDHLQLDRAEAEKWRSLLERLPPYAINQDGALREWLYPGLEDQYEHRHVSHLYPLFPGHEITPLDPLYPACRQAVDKRLVSLECQTGWSFVHMAYIYARLGQGERALECLTQVSRACTGANLFTYHNDWRGQGMSWYWYRVTPCFQIDAALGYTGAVLEMLIASWDKELYLLPALPKAWSWGEVKGVMTRCGATVSLRWHKPTNTFRAELTAAIDGHCHVHCPFDWGIHDVALCKGKTVVIYAEDSMECVHYHCE